jgi:hypothetical protein
MPHESVIMKAALSSLCLILCLACGTASAEQSASALSNASGLIAEGASTVVYGSLSAVAASGTVVVESVQVAGDASIVVLAGASDATRATLRLSGNVLQGASVVAGASVVVMAVSTGYVLVSAGKVIAFIPNEIGSALLHHSRVGG